MAVAVIDPDCATCGHYRDGHDQTPPYDCHATPTCDCETGYVEPYVRLRLVPVTLAEARAFVARVHRHNEPPLSHRVSVGISDDTGLLRGVAILGRPVARGSDDGRTAEVYRVATDGVRNGCSMLYGACARAAFALGYDRVITYILEEEPGTSLRAAGWESEGLTDERLERRWESSADTIRRSDRPTLFYAEKHPVGRKVRWARTRAAL